MEWRKCEIGVQDVANPTNTKHCFLVQDPEPSQLAHCVPQFQSLLGPLSTHSLEEDGES